MSLTWAIYEKSLRPISAGTESSRACWISFRARMMRSAAGISFAIMILHINFFRVKYILHQKNQYGLQSLGTLFPYSTSIKRKISWDSLALVKRLTKTQQYSLRTKFASGY